MCVCVRVYLLLVAILPPYQNTSILSHRLHEGLQIGWKQLLHVGKDVTLRDLASYQCSAQVRLHVCVYVCMYASCIMFRYYGAFNTCAARC